MPDKDWDGVTLEETLRKMLAAGKEKEAIEMMRLLPENLKAKYRKVWVNLMKEKECRD
jgi:hypothetical protein